VYLGSDNGIGRGAGAPYQEFGGTPIGVLSPLSQPSSCSESYRSVNHPCPQTGEDGFGLSAVSPPCAAKVIESNSDAASNEITNTNAQVNYDSGVGVDNPVCGGCPVRRTK
jgi:hypothetical protein